MFTIVPNFYFTAEKGSSPVLTMIRTRLLLHGVIMQCIYCFWFNSEPDKFYIGKSSSPKSRFRQHLLALKNNSHHSIKAQEIYNKYREDPIFEILEECLDIVVNDREIMWINEFNSFFNGLNCTTGGEGFGYGVDTPHSIYTKRQILKVFALMLRGKYTYEYISKKTGVSIGAMKSIRRGTAHGWLSSEYPIQWNILKNTQHRIINITTLAKQGKHLPSYISPDGTIYKNITNLKEFVYSLKGVFDKPLTAYKEFSSMNRGRAKSYKGWKLYNP